MEILTPPMDSEALRSHQKHHQALLQSERREKRSPPLSAMSACVYIMIEWVFVMASWDLWMKGHEVIEISENQCVVDNWC